MTSLVWLGDFLGSAQGVGGQVTVMSWQRWQLPCKTPNLDDNPLSHSCQTFFLTLPATAANTLRVLSGLAPTKKQIYSGTHRVLPFTSHLCAQVPGGGRVCELGR